MVQSMKSSLDFLQAPSFDNYVASPYGDLASAVSSDSGLAAYAASNAVTVNHPSGTCQMGSDSSQGGVVDSQLRVRGAAGLRVVDASIFVSASTIVKTASMQPLIPTLFFSSRLYPIATFKPSYIRSLNVLPISSPQLTTFEMTPILNL